MQTHAGCPGSLIRAREVMDQESLSFVPGPQVAEWLSWCGPATWVCQNSPGRTYKTAQTFFFFLSLLSRQGAGKKMVLSSASNSGVSPSSFLFIYQTFLGLISRFPHIQCRCLLNCCVFLFVCLFAFLYLWQVSLCASRSVVFLLTAGPEMASVFPIHLWFCHYLLCRSSSINPKFSLQEKLFI